jgi:hypothetical protein
MQVANGEYSNTTKLTPGILCLVVNCIPTFGRNILPPPLGSVNLAQVDAEVEGKNGMFQLNG